MQDSPRLRHQVRIASVFAARRQLGCIARPIVLSLSVLLVITFETAKDADIVTMECE